MQRSTVQDLAVPRQLETCGEQAVCLVCGNSEVENFLDLGTTALANKFLTEAELSRPEARYPLRVGFCRDCGHVQLTETVPPDAMFTDYLYVSAASDTLREHFDDLSRTLTERYGLGADDLVIDIGCNDASLLGSFAKLGVRTLGVDPAENLAERAKQSGIERYVGFFGADTAGEIVDQWGQADLITATNTFPHIPDLAGFLKGIDIALEPGGRFVVEAHYLVDLFDQLAFDTVYHEHVSYWALGPMSLLFQRHGLQVVDAERLPLHHGQLRVTVQRQGEGVVGPSVDAILEMERDRGVDRLATWKGFADQVLGIKRDLLNTLRGLKAEGSRLAGYGAPAKGSTLLEFLEIGPDLLDFIADRSSLKQGRYTPGSHIPIVSPERLLTDRPDYVLLLAWNFVDEIMDQQRAYRAAGGKFILPVPEVRIV
ncbi:methyltransferase domain-containing protein [Gemmatimonadota bacterium]